MNKMQKMDMARKMLKIQTVWNNNMKNERLSAQKRKQAQAITSVLDKNRKLARKCALAQNNKNNTAVKRTSSLPSHLRFKNKTDEALSQLGNIWGHSNMRKNNEARKELMNQLQSRNE